MELWNVGCIIIGTSSIVGAFVGSKDTISNERYVEKILLKYGKVNEKKAIRLRRDLSYISGITFILIGLILRSKESALVGIIFSTLLLIILSNLIKKKSIK